MAAFHGDREFGIGEGEIDDGAQPVALDLFGEKMAENLGNRQCRHRDPERLAADAAVETVEEIGPIHRRGLLDLLLQSLSFSFNRAAIR